jgi:hypothetical protein
VEAILDTRVRGQYLGEMIEADVALQDIQGKSAIKLASTWECKRLIWKRHLVPARSPLRARWLQSLPTCVAVQLADPPPPFPQALSLRALPRRSGGPRRRCGSSSSARRS